MLLSTVLSNTPILSTDSGFNMLQKNLRIFYFTNVGDQSSQPQKMDKVFVVCEVGIENLYVYISAI
jgi:hypothetical protein